MSSISFGANSPKDAHQAMASTLLKSFAALKKQEAEMLGNKSTEAFHSGNANAGIDYYEKAKEPLHAANGLQLAANQFRKKTT